VQVAGDDELVPTLREAPTQGASGTRIRRRYTDTETPLGRLSKSKAVRVPKELRESMNPFELSGQINQQLNAIYQYANLRHS
jgi:hypothetical protein